MNSVERVMTSLAGGEPDRVAVMEFVIDPGVAAAAVPGAKDVADAAGRGGGTASGAGGLCTIPVAGWQL